MSKTPEVKILASVLFFFH